MSLLCRLVLGVVVAEGWMGSKCVSREDFSDMMLMLLLVGLDISVFGASTSVEEEIWLLW